MRWFRGALSWLVDQAIEHWVTIAVVAGGSIMTYLASASSWLLPYGYVVWGAVGIASLLALSLVFFLYALGARHAAIADYTKSKSTTLGVNVLAATHQRERINFSDFFHPYYHPTENIRFEDCELLGPAFVVIDGCSFSHSGFFDCEIVIVREDRPVKGAMMMRFCTFLRSKIYRITFVMNYQQYINLPDKLRASIPVISDGRIGNV